jgi:hypothetical protein
MSMLVMKRLGLILGLVATLVGLAPVAHAGPVNVHMEDITDPVERVACMVVFTITSSRTHCVNLP